MTAYKKLPYEIFAALASVVVVPTVEVGFMNMQDNILRILLTQRAADDAFWPDQWHVPGSVIRATDAITHEHDYLAALERVYAEVGLDIQSTSQPVEFETVHRAGARGTELTVRFLVTISDETKRGKLFDVDDILKNPPKIGLVETHHTAIASFANAYRTQN